MEGTTLIEVSETKFASAPIVFPSYYGCNIFAYKVISLTDIIRVTVDPTDASSSIRVEIAETTLYSALKEPPITAIEFNDRFKQALEILSRSSERKIKKLSKKR